MAQAMLFSGSDRGVPRTGRGAYRRATPGDEAQPMMEMNTTPLIDVMLVLLIMLIITIPVQSHSVTLDLPGTPPPETRVHPQRNRLDLAADGTAAWNGVVVDDPALRTLLARVGAMPIPAEVHFRPAADARYARVDAVLAMAVQSGVGTLGFVGNEAYRAAF